VECAEQIILPTSFRDFGVLRRLILRAMIGYCEENGGCSIKLKENEIVFDLIHRKFIKLRCQRRVSRNSLLIAEVSIDLRPQV
jgi:hypothetical protein